MGGGVGSWGITQEFEGGKRYEQTGLAVDFDAMGLRAGRERGYRRRRDSSGSWRHNHLLFWLWWPRIPRGRW